MLGSKVCGRRDLNPGYQLTSKVRGGLMS